MALPSSLENSMPPPQVLTLIVAATEKMGIGKSGKLPWPTLKREMAYFARATKKPPTGSPTGTVNTIIMGRKTWESIPMNFRPLKDRLNVVVSRTMEHDSHGNFVLAHSLEDAIARQPEHEYIPYRTQHGHMFVIGGGALYTAALNLDQTQRILLTKIKKDFDCDTLFPLDLDGPIAKAQGWTRRSNEELAAFLGEGLTPHELTEAGIDFEFCLYEKCTGR